MHGINSVASVNEYIFGWGGRIAARLWRFAPSGAQALCASDQARLRQACRTCSNPACMELTPSPASVKTFFWLGWQDSNLRVPGSKPGALPLGDTPFGGGRYCAFAGCGCQTECESGGHALLGAENLVQMRSFGGAGRSQGVGALRYDEIDAASLFLRGDAPRQNTAWKRLEAVVVYAPVQLLKAR